MQVANTQTESHFDLTLKDFLFLIRDAQRAARAQERKELRAELIRQAGDTTGHHVVHHADCRKFRWPAVDVIATDPPWNDLRCYRWLAKFARKKLRPGGLLIVQCSNQQLAKVLPIFAEFTYLRTLSLTYFLPLKTKGRPPFMIGWCPIVVFANGKPTKFTGWIADSVIEYGRSRIKSLHDWQQSLKPWCHWMAYLTRPGELIADPFAGVATVGCAVKLAGGRKYLGTEIDGETAKVAQGRIAELKVK
ncbi:hypothetical protein AYO44_10550 [Planctomycetaceae bacterium SCGC AG-212-F19]|nr:hypothetical protein AYO44_10550 [Planctomycetaceae bacterium SCGC AG-212-F19]